MEYLIKINYENIKEDCKNNIINQIKNDLFD